MITLTLTEGSAGRRRTPVIDGDHVPAPLDSVHRARVWATLHVQEGSVRYREHEGVEPRDVRVEAGHHLPIAPGVAHHVEPSPDARFVVQFDPSATGPFGPHPDEHPTFAMAPPWPHRGRDLDSPDEVAELVFRLYVGIRQDPELERLFAFGGRLTDWYAHVLAGIDVWSRALFDPSRLDIEPIVERFTRRHEHEPFTAESFDRWLEVFTDTVDGGWTGPNADRLRKRATGLVWVVANRTLGRGVWRPALAAWTDPPEVVPTAVDRR